jgi:hypothetical protein
MPTLLLFAPCEKVIVDQDDVVSLISILQEANVQLTGADAPPENASAPMQWAIFALWKRDDSDGKDTFEQRAALASASGAILLESVAILELTQPFQRVVHLIAGLPVGTAGKHAIKLWLRRRADPPAEWKEVASFPLTINHISPKTSDPMRH